jgi:uncharacterized membrane protein
MTPAGGPTTPPASGASASPDPPPSEGPSAAPASTPGEVSAPSGEAGADAPADGAASGSPFDAVANGRSTGGPPGTPRHGLPPLRPEPRASSPSWLIVVLLVAIGLGGGFLMKAPCLDTYQTPGGVALDWRDGRQYTNLCYSDTIPLYGLERLSDGSFPYKTSWTDDDGATVRYMEYPVLTGLLQYGVMRTAKTWVSVFDDQAQPDPPEVVVYFDVMAVVLAFAWLIAVLATVPLLGRRRWDVLLLAVSPLVIVHVFTNFDALAVALAAGGMLAWTRRRPTLAGVLFGLGAAAKLYPLFVLGPLLLLGLRTGKLGSWGRAAGAAAVTWLAVNLPIALLYPDGWREFFRLNSTRPADHDTVYFAMRILFGWQGFDGPLPPGTPPRVLNAVTLLLFAVVCLLVALIAWTAPVRPRVASLSFLVVAGFLLTNKVWSPQYSLWLVPLAVLAVARWKPVLLWMAVDAAIWYPRMHYFLTFDDRTTKIFVTGVLVRDLLVLALCAIVVRDIYRPSKDPVRRAGDDDPCGGIYEDAPDRPVRWLPWPRKPEPVT